MTPVLVLGTSGRMLAWAASAAGYAVDVADLCADADCRSLVRQHHLLGASPGRPWTPAAADVRALARTWVAQHPHGRLLVGAGFESQPDLLNELATLAPLAGNSGAVVQAAKDARHLAALCDLLGLAFPALHRAMPADHRPLLRKPVAGSGGLGIRPWHASDDAADAPHYLQEQQPGEAVSLLFLALDEPPHALPVSVQRQYLARCEAHPFRFGAVVHWPEAPAALHDALLAAAGGLAAQLGLRGLNGLDGLWDGHQLWVLEINPRPPLSLALLERAQAARLLQLHMNGGRPQGALPMPGGLSPGVALVYASRTLSIPADFRFPPGCHDVPVLPHHCAPGAPLCSVHVATGGLEELRARIRDLRECLLPVAGVESVSSP